MLGFNVRVVVVAALAVCAAAAPGPRDGNEKRQFSGSAQQQMQQIVNTYQQNTRANLGGSCTEDNIVIRREWGDLSQSDRMRYIDAVKCLANLPALTSRSFASGARNRRDDFDVTHIRNTQDVHNSPLLLLWHREFVYKMERALIDECGWTEGQPYMDYAKYAEVSPEQNPMFDGSASSLSGNGNPNVRSNHTGDNDNGDCNCVTDGPLGGWTVNVGPVGSLCVDNPQDDGLGYNPRCLSRNFKTQELQKQTYQNVVDTLLRHTDITDFGVYLEGTMGLHPSPHAFVGGIQGDIPGSSADPWFYCHHAGLERLHSIWVSLDFQNRLGRMPDTNAYRDYREGRGWPMVPQPTLQTILNYSPVQESVRIGDIVNPTSGRYCYIYL